MDWVPDHLSFRVPGKHRSSVSPLFKSWVPMNRHYNSYISCTIYLLSMNMNSSISHTVSSPSAAAIHVSDYSQALPSSPPLAGLFPACSSSAVPASSTRPMAAEPTVDAGVSSPCGDPSCHGQRGRCRRGTRDQAHGQSRIGTRLEYSCRKHGPLQHMLNNIFLP